MRSLQKVTQKFAVYSLMALLLNVMFSSSAFTGWDEGVAAFKAKNFRIRTAAKEFKAASVQNSDTWGNHYMLGLSLMKMGQTEAGMRSLRAAYDLNLNDLSLKADLKDVLNRKGNAQIAALHYLYGTTAYSLGLKAEAKRAYEQGLRVNPDSRKLQNVHGLPKVVKGYRL